jgi:hypothetical protein
LLTLYPNSPIAFHPASVLFETPSHAVLIEKTGVRQMISEVMEELLRIAQAQNCVFPSDFKKKTMDEMIKPTEIHSIMYQDFAARRPMEVETYLGSPIKLAQGVGVKTPRIETLYTLLHHINTVNQQRPKEIPMGSPMPGGGPPMQPRLSSAPPPRPPMNGSAMGRGRARTSSMGVPPGMPGQRRGPPSMNGGSNGYPRPMTNGYGGPPRPMGQQSRRGSMDNDLGEEFSHLVLYDNIPEGGEGMPYGDVSDIALRERELMLRQREIALREQEMRMRSRGGGMGGGPRRGPPTPSVRNGGFDDDDDEEDYFDPTAAPVTPMIDPDNFDMMSVTSKRNRKAPMSSSQIRKNPETDPGFRGGRGSTMRPGYGRNRSSANIIANMPTDHDSIMDDPMMNFTSNRYGTVDHQQLRQDSRTNSLTAARLEQMQYSGGAPNGGAYPRRSSQSPGNPYSPQVGRGNGRPSPPNGYRGPPNGNGRPSPPGGMRQPVPRYPPGQGNSVAPQQVEQHAGVSALHPQKGPMNVRSLTGSASASAGSGDSGASAHLDSENSAHSSQSSLGARPAIGVR